MCTMEKRVTIGGCARNYGLRRRDPRRRSPRADRQSALAGRRERRRRGLAFCRGRPSSETIRRRPASFFFFFFFFFPPPPPPSRLCTASPRRFDRVAGGGAARPGIGPGRASPADCDVLRPGGIDGALDRDGPRRSARCHRLVSEPVQWGDPAYDGFVANTWATASSSISGIRAPMRTRPSVRCERLSTSSRRWRS